MTTPTTDAEYRAALEAEGCRFIDNGSSFSVQHGPVFTRLEADNYSDALVEAYHLVYSQ